MRYSIQRETIYETLKHTTSHPDAEWVYGQVKKVLPNISLGTVYRNLKLLVDEKKVLTLETEDFRLHYDADVSAHSHFICLDCNSILDIFHECEYPKSLGSGGYEVESIKALFYGKCPQCALKKVLTAKDETVH